MVVEERRSFVAPKNHSKVGKGVFRGRGLGVISAEHCRVTGSPTVAVMGPEGEMVTGPMSTG